MAMAHARSSRKPTCRRVPNRRALPCAVFSLLLVSAGAQGQTSAPSEAPKAVDRKPASATPQKRATAAPAKPAPNAGNRTPADGLTSPAAHSAPADQPSVQERPATDPTARPEHMLSGVWKVYWMDQNKTTELRIAQVYPGREVTNFVGAMATLGGEACPITGTVIDTLAGRFSDGLELKAHMVSAFVVLRAQCQSGQIWIEALGLPAGQVLMSGRATSIAANAARSYTAVGLGR